MRAAPCVASVIMPAWLPVNERASNPIEWIAMASSAIEMRSPLESSMSSSRGRGDRRDLRGEVEQFVGGVAHGADRDDDVVPGAARVDDALGDALDALGVGDGRAAVLLDDQRHGGDSKMVNRAGCPRFSILRTPSFRTRHVTVRPQGGRAC